MGCAGWRAGPLARLKAARLRAYVDPDWFLEAGQQAAFMFAQTNACGIAITVGVASQRRKAAEQVFAAVLGQGLQANLAGMEAFAGSPLGKDDLVLVEQQMHIGDTVAVRLCHGASVHQMFCRKQYFG